MRKKEDIQKELDKVEGQLWFIKMGDRWTAEDYRADSRLREKKRELEEELKRCSLREKNLSALAAEVKESD